MSPASTHDRTDRFGSWTNPTAKESPPAHLSKPTSAMGANSVAGPGPSAAPNSRRRCFGEWDGPGFRSRFMLYFMGLSAEGRTALGPMESGWAGSTINMQGAYASQGHARDLENFATRMSNEWPISQGSSVNTTCRGSLCSPNP